MTTTPDHPGSGDSEEDARRIMRELGFRVPSSIERADVIAAPNARQTFLVMDLVDREMRELDREMRTASVEYRKRVTLGLDVTDNLGHIQQLRQARGRMN